MPRLYIISGCNGAGKTTASYSLLPEMLECREFVNSDEFAKGLSPFDPSKASIQASRYMLMKIRYLLKKQKDFAVETTLATRTLLKTVRMAQNAGYTVTLLYFWLNTPELAIERVRARVEAGGHDIPEETNLVQEVVQFIDSLKGELVPELNKINKANKATVGTFFSIRNPQNAMRSFGTFISKIDWSKSESLKELFSPFMYLGEEKPV